MILKDNFYKINSIEQTDNDTFTVNVRLLPEHHIYKGHFPEKPVVPGVCTLTVIKECLGEIYGRTVEYDAIKECKYISALLPEENLDITINITVAEGAKTRVSVIKDKDQQPVLKLRATIR